MFPAWIGFAGKCDSWSCSCGSEFQLVLESQICLKHALLSILAHFNLHPGQQKRNENRCTYGSPDRGKVSWYLSCLSLWMWKKLILRVHLIFFHFFHSNAGSNSLSNTESECEQSEVEPLWHPECHPNSITAHNDLTHFSVCLVTQGKIPLSNCWSLKLTRSTRWRRYNKYRRSAKVVWGVALSSPQAVREEVLW